MSCLRASRAKLQRLEKETKDMEQTMEALRHSQAKVAELEKTSKRLQEQTHVDRRENIRLREELQALKSKVTSQLGGPVASSPGFPRVGTSRSVRAAKGSKMECVAMRNIISASSLLNVTIHVHVYLGGPRTCLLNSLGPIYSGYIHHGVSTSVWEFIWGV